MGDLVTWKSFISSFRFVDDSFFRTRVCPERFKLFSLSIFSCFQLVFISRPPSCQGFPRKNSVFINSVGGS